MLGRVGEELEAGAGAGHTPERVVFRSLPTSLKLGVPRRQQATLCPAPRRPPAFGTSHTESVCSPACAHRDLRHMRRETWVPITN